MKTEMTHSDDGFFLGGSLAACLAVMSLALWLSLPPAAASGPSWADRDAVAEPSARHEKSSPADDLRRELSGLAADYLALAAPRR